MKTIFKGSVAAAVVLLVTSPCFALWEIAPVSKQEAKELGLEVRSIAAGPNDVRIELEFKVAGKLADFNRVELRFGERERSVSAALKEDRSKPGRVSVSLVADRAQLDKITLWIMIPGVLGGTIYEVRAKEFIDLPKLR
jgi:hypothetical protein